MFFFYAPQGSDNFFSVMHATHLQDCALLSAAKPGGGWVGGDLTESQEGEGEPSKRKKKSRGVSKERKQIVMH